MLKTLIGTAGRNQPLQALIELVEALERRVPRPHAAGERQIAADSAELHAQASERILEIRQASLSQENTESRTAQSVMTDDGAPVRLCPDCADVSD
jgi:hypothetical protein